LHISTRAPLARSGDGQCGEDDQQQPAKLAFGNRPAGMHHQHRHQQHGNDWHTGQSGRHAEEDQDRADHFGDDRRDQAEVRPEAKGIFDPRQFFAEMHDLRQAVHVQQQQAAGDPQEEQPQVNPGQGLLS